MPFLQELIEEPFEVWLTFERHRGTGKVVLRRRSIKLLGIPGGSLLFVAHARAGLFEGWTLVPATPTQLMRWRLGKLVWGRGGSVTEVAGAVPGAG
ncbi:hypothetical protein DF3PA_80026 [Candidatus Defluviicoccus seviourii]|uniref:Phage-Barnase-EndoU-ColicinE5/D-RelE like nuclease 2 domain-containing protein n=1 Tax=Candidatus Defluviicoccus seviourii TaxID=2565273 RepID=A0A564WHD7_9PROT|nr:hypothetical protein DF3PA_80026 [Candidatus Defluviicoccus seviourii]